MEQNQIADCHLPNYLAKCTDCLITSFDGRDHSSSCLVKKFITSVNMNINAEKPMAMVKMRFENPYDQVFAFNKMTGAFEVWEDRTQIHAHEVNSIFGIRKINDKKTVDIEATILNRFSIAVTYFVDGAWRLRYRIVMTQSDGVIFFPMRSTMENRTGLIHLPNNFTLNTALVIGVKAHEDMSTIKLRVYAGSFDRDFYEASIQFDQFYDKANASDRLLAKKNTDTIRFARKL